MVPGVVAQVLALRASFGRAVAQDELLSIATIQQCPVLESDEELAAGTHIGLTSRAVAHQRTGGVGGAEPEHQRVVLLVVTVEEPCVQLQSLQRLLLAACLVLVNLQGHALWQCPGGSMERQVRALCLVGRVGAAALVHRVVVYEPHLVAGQQPVQIAVHVSLAHGTVPHTALQHVALEETHGLRVIQIGSTKGQRAISAVGHVAQHVDIAAVERQLLAVVVEHQSHMLEAYGADGLLALQHLVVDNGLQLLVGREPQLQAAAVCAMREDGHVVLRVIGAYHHLYGHALVAEVAAGFCLGVSVATELQRRRLLDGGLVGLAAHLEVGGGLQVVVFDVFREAEHDVVTGTHHARLGFRRAKQLRAARVLHTAEHLRLAGQERIAVSAEQHGPQVVGLLHHGAFAKEAGGDVAVVGYHLLGAAGIAVDERVGVESTEVRPVVVATCRLLILELDVVEVVLVLVEAADDDRQIPALALLGGCVAVHDPLVAGHRDSHLARRLQEVHVEGHLVEDIEVAQRDDAYLQTFVVEILAGIHLQRLLRHLTGAHLDGTHVTRERHTVDEHLRPLGVRLLQLVDVEVVVGRLGLLALVGQVEFEAGGLVEGHTAQALLVHADDGVLYLLCPFVHHRTGIIEQRLALALPRTAGGAAAGAVDETACITEVIQVQVAAQVVFVVVHE